jgi:DNA-binding beta-propeller fold protein YncE
MKMITRIGTGLAVAALAAATTVVGLAAVAAPAGATPAPHFFFGGGDHAVFVQTDNLAGNQVVAYRRGPDGSLTWDQTYDTGGLGGQLSGSVADHLASQASLTYDPVHRQLFAVNAGSNTVSVFSVSGDQLALRQIIASGGTFPVSVAVHGDLVEVLNAENGGSVQGYVDVFGHLFAVPGSNRTLGLDPTATPQFVNTPGQVAFSPDGSQLIVTTKANGSDIDVFGVGFFGRLSPTPVVNSEPGTVPFGVTFNGRDQLVVAEAGTNALETFQLSPDGTLTAIDALGNGQAATCWVAPAGGYLYASNAGSGDVSGYEANGAGQLSLVGTTPTDPGTVDASSSSDGHYLYVQTGINGIVDAYSLGAGGALSSIGSVTVPNAAGGEGIVAF